MHYSLLFVLIWMVAPNPIPNKQNLISISRLNYCDTSLKFSNNEHIDAYNDLTTI